MGIRFWVPFSGNMWSDDWDNRKMDLESRMEGHGNNQLLNYNITEGEVRHAISRLKLGKAAGCDELTNELIKAPPMFPVLFRLIQFCFESSLVPDAWLNSIVKPIPKSSNSDPRVPMNYRGISLLSCVYKLYSSILNHRLLFHLEESGLLADEQNGFRKNRSCVDHIYSLTSIVYSRLHKGKPTFCGFVDFHKAFDCLNRDLLCFKLLSAGVDGYLYKALKALYRNTVGCVQINEHRTGWFPTPSGVKQGDILSPTLFALFINDLLKEIKQSTIGVRVGDLVVSTLCYADDLVLLAESEIDLQTLFNIVSRWCSKWRMTINNDKTKVIHFRNKRDTVSKFTFKSGSTSLSYTNSYKYLGLTLDEHLTFEEGTKILSDSAGRALGAVINKIKLCRDLGFKSYTQLYLSCVCPISDYAAGVWGYCKFINRDMIQDRAMRCFLGVHKLAPKLAVRGDMGWEPPVVRHKGDMVRLWNRLISMPDNRLTKQIFKWDLLSGQSWGREIENIFEEAGLQYIFRNKLKCSLKQIKSILFVNYKQKWAEEIWLKPKLRTYCLIKSTFQSEPYVTLNLTRYQRSVCAQFRCGILPLALETGRFHSIPEEDRKCCLCHLDVVENEIHFLLYCPLYHPGRHVLFSKIPDLFSLSDEAKMSYMFDNNAFPLAKFMLYAYELRKSTLFVVR